MVDLFGSKNGVFAVISALETCSRVLTEARFEIIHASAEQNAIAFENETILGVAIAYENAPTLLGRWEADAEELLSRRRFQLRAAGTKAWNTYVILIASERATSSEAIALSLIEEDLSGYRKIAKAGCRDRAELNRALLPLVPFQSAPTLDAVDSKLEVRQRATDVPANLLDLFLSDADPQVVLSLMEQET